MNTRTIWLTGLISWILVDYLMRIFLYVGTAASAGISIPLESFPFSSFVIRDSWYLLPKWFCLVPPLTLLAFYPRPQNTFTWRHGLAFGLGFSILGCFLAVIWLSSNRHSIGSIGVTYWIFRFLLSMPGPMAAGLLIGSIQKKVLA